MKDHKPIQPEHQAGANQEEKKFRGIIIPAITPLTSNFKLDKQAVEKIFENFYRHGVSPFILGTTGESTSLPVELKQKYVKKAGKLKEKNTVLYAGISSNCFEESVNFANYCFDHGLDAVAATLPSYYALTESQVKKYFIELADKINGPLIIYNIPATTHMSIPVQLAEELSYHPNIAGIKDSERSEERLQQSLALWKDRQDFGHFLGWAARSVPALFSGSAGLIPSTGNLVPEIYAAMWRAVMEGNRQKANDMQELSDAYGNLYQAGKTLGESLWALKYLMQEENLCNDYVMPPLHELGEQETGALKRGLKELKELQRQKLSQ